MTAFHTQGQQLQAEIETGIQRSGWRYGNAEIFTRRRSRKRLRQAISKMGVRGPQSDPQGLEQRAGGRLARLAPRTLKHTPGDSCPVLELHATRTPAVDTPLSPPCCRPADQASPDCASADRIGSCVLTQCTEILCRPGSPSEWLAATCGSPACIRRFQFLRQ